MTKIKLSLALFAAYLAGELVTTAMGTYRLNKAFKNNILFTFEDVQEAALQTYYQGGRDALDDKEAVEEAYAQHNPSASPILDYTNV